MPSAETDRALATALAALGNPTRIAILRELVSPRPLNHIRVHADAEEGEEPGRPLSRQAVRAHLDRLVEISAVRALLSEDARVGGEYVVDPTRIYALAEELRDLAALRPEEVAAGATSPSLGQHQGRAAKGPRLVVARGLREGAAFPLHQEPGREPRAWVVGRRRGLDVSLDYDPYVSAENAIIARGSDGFTLRDVPGSRNGVLLNFERISPDGAPVPLAHGDLVGVGRSVLAFRER